MSTIKDFFEEYNGKDIVEVVRCKGCKHWHGDSEMYEGVEYKKCWIGGMYYSPDHYCAFGERSE